MSEQTNALHLARSRILELEQALERAKEQIDEDCFTTESKAVCLERINRLMAPVIAARYARSVLNKENGNG